MEYVAGETLMNFAQRTNDLGRLLDVSYLYLEIIEETTTPDTRHGDPTGGTS